MNSENQTSPPLPSGEQLSTAHSKPRLNLLPFFAALFAPPVVTLLSALVGFRDFPVVCAVVSSALGGIACGVMLGMRAGKTTGTRVALGILFTLIFVVVCFVMSFMGCMAGGFKVRMQ